MSTVLKIQSSYYPDREPTTFNEWSREIVRSFEETMRVRYSEHHALQARADELARSMGVVKVKNSQN